MVAGAQHLELLTEKSLLGLFLDSGTIQQLAAQYPLHKVSNGTTVFSEGQAAHDIFIPMQGKISLTSRDAQGRVVPGGSLAEGRSANLYAVVRGGKYQYSGVADGNILLLRIPWSVLRPYAEEKPGFLRYLRLMTESPAIRDIKRELEDTGCSNDFVIQLIGNLESKSFPSQTWICHPGKAPDSAFMVTQGVVQIFKQTKDGRLKVVGEVPRQTWQFFAECAAGRAGLGAKCNVTATVFCLPKAAITELKSAVAEDFTRFSQWLEGHTVEDEDDVDEDVKSLDDLFPKMPKGVKHVKFSYPWIAQNDQMDCGPACLAMISKFWGNEIPIQYWRDRVHTNREGTSLFDLAQGAERQGFIAHGIAVDEIHEVEKNYLPCIALRQYHFMVIYKITKKFVIVGDPAMGVYRMSIKDFSTNFEKAVLLLRPTEAFYKIQATKPGFGHYLGLLKGYEGLLFLALFCSLMTALFESLPGVISQVVVDDVLSRKDLKLLWFVIGVGAVGSVFYSAFLWIQEYYFLMIETKIDFNAASTFLRKMFNLPFTFFASRHTGDFTRRLAEMERVRKYFMQVLIFQITASVFGIFNAIFLFLYSPTIAMATVLLTFGMVSIGAFAQKKLKSDFAKAFTTRAEQEGILTDFVKGISTIKVLGAEVAARWRYEEKMIETLRSNLSFGKTRNWVICSADLYTNLTKYGMMCAAAVYGIRDKLSPGQVIATVILVRAVIDPVTRLMLQWSAFSEIFTIMSRLDDVFLAPSENENERSKVIKPRLRGQIEFQNVWFRYGGESSDWVLKGVSFRIEPGQHVAVVGPSGGGKSTLAGLIARLYEPTSGTILIDGRDVREYDMNWLRQQVGLLQQHSKLFSGTIAENIAFGDPKIDMDRVVESAKIVDAHNFITAKSTSYQYFLAAGGMGLSGGQKQRLAFARLLYSQPSLLVLDEATASLDGLAEQNLLKNLKPATKGLTVINISHKFTTTLASDYVMAMENGRVVAFGTHAELEATCPLYVKLFGLEKRSAA